MPKRSNVFQTLIYQIQQYFSDGSEYIVSESKMLRNSANDEEREVDIVVETKAGDVSLVIGFECTAEKRIVGSPWVERMLGKHRYLGTDKLILVSESGFTQPALKLVDSEKFAEAVTLKDAEATDWGGYIKSYKDLIFGAFEFKPIKISANFETIENESDKESPLTITKDTKFRRISDGTELDSLSLALDILGNQDLAKNIMDRWLKQPKESRKLEFDFLINWAAVHGTWEIVNESLTRRLLSIDLTVKALIKESNLSFSHKSFMNTSVSYATIESAFSTSDNKKGNKVIVAITGKLSKAPKISVAFPGAKPGEKKIFSTELNDTSAMNEDQSERKTW